MSETNGQFVLVDELPQRTYSEDTYKEHRRVAMENPTKWLLLKTCPIKSASYVSCINHGKTVWKGFRAKSRRISDAECQIYIQYAG